jgi:hypothetical protein
LRDLAAARYRSFSFGNHPPPDADRIVATGARVYRFSNGKTFYLITVDKAVQSILSAACPHEVCTTSWWPATTSFLADLDRPPSAVPGDEFYAVTSEMPAGQAVLVTSDVTSDNYDLGDECLVTLQGNVQSRQSPPSEHHRNAHNDTIRRIYLQSLAAQRQVCAPDAVTLCLLENRFAVTLTNRSSGGHKPASVGARGIQAGTFGLYAPDYWDVLVNIGENCRATKTFIVTYVSMNTDPYDLTVTDTTTGITKTFSATNGPRRAATYDNTTFHCE